MTSEADVKAMVAFAVERYEKLDFACNNAGIEGPQVPIAEIPRDGWDRVVAVKKEGMDLEVHDLSLFVARVMG